MRRSARVSTKLGLFGLILLLVLQGQSLSAQGGGGANKGTVTSVSATNGLTATPNPITTTGSVGIATSGVTNNMLGGGITNAKLVNSSVTVSAGTGLSGGGLVSLGGTTTLSNTGVLTFNTRAGAVTPTLGDYTFSLISGTAAKIQLPAATAYTDAANAFTTNQSIAGNLSLTGSGNLSVAGGNINLPDTSGAAAGVLKLGAGTPFLHGFGGFSSTFVGRGAGNFTMSSGLEGGSFNTGVGTGVLSQASSGVANTGLGFETLLFNSSGSYNTGLGSQALFNNQTGNHNTAVGFNVLSVQTSGDDNTGVGYRALEKNAGGIDNTAIGVSALFGNQTGTANTASGFNALLANTGGSYNTASGFNALLANTGGSNTAIGAGALSTNTTGLYNIGIGYNAGIGATTGSYNIYIGNSSAVAAEGNTIRIGDGNQTRAFIAGITGVTTGAAGTAVVVDANGQLGTNPSSRRYKYDIQNMGATSKLLQLRPVTFRYKQAQSDGSHPMQYGLIAEEVADLYPELVQYDPKTGEPNAVLYQFLPSMLLNAFQKEHRQVEAQQQQIQTLQEQLARVLAQTEQLQSEIAAIRIQQKGGNTVAAVAQH